MKDVAVQNDDTHVNLYVTDYDGNSITMYLTIKEANRLKREIEEAIKNIIGE